MTIHVLGATSALLLQGPAGPFMQRLGDELRASGIRATKVNFHAGESVYCRGRDTLHYRGTFEQWPDWVRALMRERAVDAVFLFGDCRPLHKMAIEVAHELGARVWVLEEGYLRPDWVTVEEDGVNGYSRMPRDPDFYRRLSLPDLPPPRPVGNSLGYASWYSVFSALAYTHLNHGYPHYRHHRNLNAWYHTGCWVKDFFWKRVVRRIEAPTLDRLTGPLSKRFYLVPLQVYCDFQIVHSDYDHVLDFVDEVLATFASYADPDHHLVLKHHPMDRAYVDYTTLMRDKARESGLNERLIYVHDLHLPTMIDHAIGTITINSTVGLQSIGQGTPVKVMGNAVYDMPGLTFQGSLREFLDDPGAPDLELYESYRRWLLHTNQVNGSYYSIPEGATTPTGWRWFPGLPDEVAAELGLSTDR